MRRYAVPTLLTGLLLTGLPLGGCVEAKLGDAPFFCNNGLPECPEGYECRKRGKDSLCVKTGASLPMPPDAKPVVDAAVVAKDVPVQFDLPPVTPDGPSRDVVGPKWDKGPPDLGPDHWPMPDGIAPHFGCQTHAECDNPNNSCCCPTPLVPLVWICLPLCFNPVCLP